MLDEITARLRRYIDTHGHPPNAIYVTKAGFMNLNAECWDLLKFDNSENIINQMYGVPLVILKDGEFVFE